VLTTNRLTISAEADTVFRLAADVLRWPQILPHYRWVKVQRDDQQRVVVEMAARRDFIPVRWVSIQEVDAERRVIRYKHIGGATKGMDVEWSFIERDGKVTAVIVHEWDPPWPLPKLLRRPLAHLAGELFVKAIADRTLHYIKLHAEQETVRPGQLEMGSGANTEETA